MTNCGTVNTGYSSGAIVLVLFILLIIILGSHI
ncbi:MAG: sporulation protein YjcZ [Bacilli bacterium]|nr:sporulation protein YjcZ [Bacilli bacterium]